MNGCFNNAYLIGVFAGQKLIELKANIYLVLWKTEMHWCVLLMFYNWCNTVTGVIKLMYFNGNE